MPFGKTVKHTQSVINTIFMLLCVTCKSSKHPFSKVEGRRKSAILAVSEETSTYKTKEP